MSDDPQSPHFETLAIRTQSPITPEREHSVPLFLTSSFRFDDAEHARALFTEEVSGNVYSRYANPNTDEFVRKLCLLEGGEDGIATASGMSAVFTALAAKVSAGDHIVASRALFGSTHQILTRVLPKWGVTSDYADVGDPGSWERLIRPNTRLLFVETPSNPGLELIDLAWLGALARARGIPLVVDNCFATPYLQRPLALGASVVVHSATKYIDGQGRALGGAIIGARDYLSDCRFFARHTGPAMSAFNAWLLSKSLETLAVRMDRHSSNALTVARHFEGHPAVESVRYPFLPSHPQYDLARQQMSQGGGIVVLVLKGGLDAGRRFLDGVQLVSHSANLGDTRTIVTHPASTTHSKLTADERAAVAITDGLIRVSVGLEHTDDIIADLERALGA
ncbi:MAG TPA: O-succinylhomoserine sulfhydrylase [Gemmatimonas aurantiaca]|uniref:O-succinylhomoserine sulfhydrylase n=2 Tax=Gemmatimonas aurantiaca TaxID=173480 RepID=C1AB57_GEMAT|nr:PLP-dependent transferase [Gemmatimonas aurantiaca]BAH39463.1 O-succinylhomoserine sulfhydrylase [Gemmatimonas aurantiaca T-27]HCT58527.1 O-succinylhomoserine sulfhydrylase [Gemmatimonas aurantiaca]